jgi:hypothetical protein
MFRDPMNEKSIDDDLKHWQGEKAKSLIKVRHLEGSLKKIEPGFQSPIKFNYYPRINKGY